MADGENAGDGACAQIGGFQLTNDIIFGQSKSESTNFVQFKNLEETELGKNRHFLVCLRCNCKILAPGYATLIEREVNLSRA